LHKTIFPDSGHKPAGYLGFPVLLATADSPCMGSGALALACSDGSPWQSWDIRTMAKAALNGC
jgi:hypothetical protein